MLAINPLDMAVQGLCEMPERALTSSGPFVGVPSPFMTIFGVVDLSPWQFKQDLCEMPVPTSFDFSPLLECHPHS